MANILMVDDESEIVDLVAVYLKNDKHTVYKFYLPEECLEAELDKIDLAILDVMMPQMDGFTLCRHLRERGFTFPIIMLTARDQDSDKINGLVLGADDYMVKPFNPLELAARVNAHLRRTGLYSSSGQQDKGLETYNINGLEVNAQAHTCFLYNKEVLLTPTEFSILLLLCQNRGKVISSERIFESVWGEKYWDNNNTVMVHIQKLRSKLSDTGKRKKFIETIWGVGYKINE